eukprot:CAMPEP_0174862818 /NCGR_PEP_ID=MMETSP1114-20130205/54927_1 /TAXON_ID=312471 /ORGANISM="Neobodo designis, Strain CCAP 1951/1" /LENGTH=36 /DNA_ID= /DNA_START= /DNA_END= /DNA_ORIENTATION=
MSSSDGLPTAEAIAQMSEAQLARWSRGLHEKTLRVR